MRDDAVPVEGEMTPAQRRANIVAVTTAMAVTALIYGLSVPLLALVLNERGVASTLIGISTAVQSVAIVLVSPFLPPLISRFGPAVLMLAAIIVSLLMFVLLPVFPSMEAWFVLRFLLGAAGSCLWVTGEAWINQVAEERTRGRVVALYSMAVAGGFALGPMLLSLTGSSGFRPFLVGAGVTAVSALPLLLVLRSAPTLRGKATARLPRFLVLAPVAMLACLLFAVIDGIALTFMPLYGLAIGLDEGMSLYLITAMGIGGIAGQLPIGWLADHVDRLLLAAACTAVVALAALGMPWALALTPWNLLYMFVYGAVLSGIYTIALVLLGEQFKGADLAAASAVFGVMWGLGSVIGPPVGGLSMAMFPPDGVPWSMALVFALFLPLPLVIRWRRQRGA